MKRNPAQRRYLWRVLPLMAGYVALLSAAEHLMSAWHPVGALLAALAIVPALPLVGVVIALGAYLAEEKDEFLRNQLVTAMLFALGVLLAAATIWGFLQHFHVVDSPPIFLAFPLWCGCFGIAKGGLSLAERWEDRP